MPLFEYKCGQCEYLFERLESRDASPPETCPKCGADSPIKQFSAFAVGTGSSSYSPEACQECPGGECPGGICPLES